MEYPSLYFRSMSVKDVSECWKNQYRERDEWYSKKSKKIHKKLLKASSMRECDKIIGNTSWTSFECSSCTRSSPEIYDFSVCDERYELCASCFGELKGTINEND